MRTSVQQIVSGFLLVGTLAHAVTLTLQQGTGGYSGCRDSFITDGGYNDDEDANFGDASTIYVNAEHYNPG